MSDQTPETPTPSGGRQGRPVLWGLVALLGVAVVVGGILGGGALAASRVLGLGDDGGSTSSGDATAAETMVIPPITSAPGDDGPSQTLLPDPENSQQHETDEPTETEEPEEEISLSALQDTVSPMQNIDLSGTYPGGDGSVLTVEIFEDGDWTDFAQVDIFVSGETFTTYIQTARSGENRFRVVDSATGEASNEIVVEVA